MLSLRRAARSLFVIDTPAPEPTEPPRPEFPCGVPDCFEPQETIRLDGDGKYIVVACPVHLCHTSWETERREAKEQRIIRVQDSWRQHGTSERPK